MKVICLKSPLSGSLSNQTKILSFPESSHLKSSREIRLTRTMVSKAAVTSRNGIYFL